MEKKLSPHEVHLIAESIIELLKKRNCSSVQINLICKEVFKVRLSECDISDKSKMLNNLLGGITCDKS